METIGKTLVQQFYSELDRQNFGVYRELCTPDFVSHFPGGPGRHSREDRERISRQFYKAFPDLRHTLADVIGDGATVAARLTMEATHRGAFMGCAPTGNRIVFTGMRFYRVRDGKLAEEWANFDSIGLLEQIGGRITSG